MSRPGCWKQTQFWETGEVLSGMGEVGWALLPSWLGAFCRSQDKAGWQASGLVGEGRVQIRERECSECWRGEGNCGNSEKHGPSMALRWLKELESGTMVGDRGEDWGDVGSAEYHAQSTGKEKPTSGIDAHEASANSWEALRTSPQQLSQSSRTTSDLKTWAWENPGSDNANVSYSLQLLSLCQVSPACPRSVRTPIPTWQPNDVPWWFLNVAVSFPIQMRSTPSGRFLTLFH